MFTIWYCKPSRKIVVQHKLDVDNVEDAQFLWDILAAAGYHMISTRP